ncbi:hypothetical protein M0813_25507 [Anaeramoeba flamelloides]|uniref:non-specific serine/threonine protein kinase n=1 Tax=Anaeramoeba flamelloides TaxID=1746091 RepID=A0ABQ8Y3R6_9EUKA|nr:hypothetical protein M0813_25507 [Anaeramoeba flamelloides]
MSSHRTKPVQTQTLKPTRIKKKPNTTTNKKIQTKAKQKKPFFHTVSSESENPKEYKKGGYHRVKTGEIFNERYEAIWKIGWGHHSLVWLVYDLKQQVFVAMKIVKSDLRFLKHAKEERIILKKISKVQGRFSERLINCYDRFYHVDYCLIFELLDENDLYFLIKKYNFKGIPIHIVQHLTRQILQGLDHLHRKCKVIHTDIKPENIMLYQNIGSIPKTIITKMKTNLVLKKKIMKIQNEKKRKFKEKQKTIKREECEKNNKNGEKTVRINNNNNSTIIINLQNKSRRTKHTKKKNSNENFQSKCQKGNGATNSKSPDNVDLLNSNSWESVLIQNNKSIQKKNNDRYANKNKTKNQDQNKNQNRKKNKKHHNNIRLSKDKSQNKNRTLKQLAKKQKTTVYVIPPNISYLCIKKKKSSNVNKNVKNNNNKTNKNNNDDYNNNKNNKNKNNRCKIETHTKNNSNNNNHFQMSRKVYSKTLKKTNKHKPYSPIKAMKQNNINLVEKENKFNLNCKIVDFGNAISMKNNRLQEIQARAYRSPEVILGYKYNQSVDIWSLGCLVYELLTGEILFYPENGINYTPDEKHLALMTQRLGKIPENILNSSLKARKFLNSNGDFIHFQKIKQFPIEKILHKKFNFPVKQALQIGSFLRIMLNYNFNQRATALECLSHPWLRK